MLYDPGNSLWFILKSKTHQLQSDCRLFMSIELWQFFLSSSFWVQSLETKRLCGTCGSVVEFFLWQIKRAPEAKVKGEVTFIMLLTFQWSPKMSKDVWIKHYNYYSNLEPKPEPQTKTNKETSRTKIHGSAECDPVWQETWLDTKLHQRHQRSDEVKLQAPGQMLSFDMSLCENCPRLGSSGKSASHVWSSAH